MAILKGNYLVQFRCSTSPTKMGVFLGGNGIMYFFCIFLLPRLGPKAVLAPQWLPVQGPHCTTDPHRARVAGFWWRPVAPSPALTGSAPDVCCMSTARAATARTGHMKSVWWMVWEKATLLPCSPRAQKKTDSQAVFAVLMVMIWMIQLNDLWWLNSDTLVTPKQVQLCLFQLVNTFRREVWSNPVKVEK